MPGPLGPLDLLLVVDAIKLLNSLFKINICICLLCMEVVGHS